ncbi:MAG: tetratricopeptide repeat protein [Alistipes sp.]|nr:tetratricopeptide repeat protein [Alistipes sp.]
MPERGLVRKGNRQFAKQRYEQSADSYQQALVYDSTSFAAKYNLGSAMFRTERYDRAEQLLTVAAADSLQSAEERAEAYYNLGNAQFAQQKLQEALQSYRRSLTLNPDDMEAKYNYAYTKKLLEQQQQNQDQQQNQGQNQDQNQDQQQNQDNQNNQNNQNQDQQDNNQNQDNKDNQDSKNNQDNQDDKQDKQGQQPPRSGMSEQQQQQLLNAIQAQEDKTQEKLDEKAKGVIIKGRKNW